MAGIGAHIAAVVIAQERHALRFEAFCNAIVGALEGGVPVMPTSRSYDLGRDGRGYSRDGAVFTCCSLRDDIDEKSQSDLRTLVEKVGIASYRVYYCSNQAISEKRASELEAALRSHVGTKVDIRVLGKEQLADLAIRHQGPLNGHYKSEIDECLALLDGGLADAEVEEVGLRLALMISGGENTSEIRTQVYENSIRLLFADGRIRGKGEIARDLAALFHLNRNLPSEVLMPHIERLESAGELLRQEDKYKISPQGLEIAKVKQGNAAEKLIEGRRHIRERIEKAIGQQLADDQYARIWSVIQEKVAHEFYTKGHQLVSDISNIIEPGVHAEFATSSSFAFVEDLANAVSQSSQHVQQRAELYDAIKDMFVDRSGPAFDWLVQLCVTYVAGCSIGLEATVGKALSRMLSKVTLVLDSDVVLSLLGHGEPDHESVTTIVSRWKSLGGNVLVARPVVHEVSHHAWIAEIDYKEVQKLLPGSEEDRARYISNAFVRGFAHLLAKKKAKPNQWRQYINQFKGAQSSDSSKVTGYLQAEYGIGELPGRGAREAVLEKDVREYLIELAHTKHAGPDVHNRIDKAKRDAKLYAALVTEIRLERNIDPSAACFLVSSARRLFEAEKKFRQLRETHIVIPISTALYMLTLVPNVSLGLGAMKAFLFDERVTRFDSDLERMLLRAVRMSSEIAMPFAKRSGLMRAVREGLIRDAKQAGMRVRPNARNLELESEALKSKNLPRTLEILSESLNAVAADTKSEQEIRKLRSKVSDLEKELERQRIRRR